uniref:Transmembrane protein n=1 Tax=Panagrolaimus superbus TaxID=310955 RepID=A0A914Z0F0_9BILA
MNCCCFKTLFVFLCFQFLFSAPSFAAKLQKHENVSNDSFIFDSNGAINEQQLRSDNLLADESVRGIANGNDIQLSGSGFINLTLTDETLQFEVCKNCRGTSRVCFDTKETYIDEKVKCSGLSSFCKFEAKYEKDNGVNENERIVFADVLVYFLAIQSYCLQPTMHTGLVPLIAGTRFKSCEPKIDGVDKMIKLYVDINALCPIKVKNAKIHAPKVLSTIPPPNSVEDDQSSTASVPVWAIVIMVLGGIAVIIIIGGFG